MTDNKYNGWTNWETWVTNLHFDDAFSDQAADYFRHSIAENHFTRKENAALGLADHIKETVEEYLAETDQKNLFLQDILNGFTGSVNWHEIAMAYMSEYDDDLQAAS